MTSATARLAVVTALAASAAGCGLGPGASSSGTATLTVTRDYGARTLVSAHQDDPLPARLVEDQPSLVVHALTVSPRRLADDRTRRHATPSHPRG